MRATLVPDEASSPWRHLQAYGAAPFCVMTRCWMARDRVYVRVNVLVIPYLGDVGVSRLR